MRISDWSSDVCSSDLDELKDICLIEKYAQDADLQGLCSERCGRVRLVTLLGIYFRHPRAELCCCCWLASLHRALRENVHQLCKQRRSGRVRWCYHRGAVEVTQRASDTTAQEGLAVNILAVADRHDWQGC